MAQVNRLTKQQRQMLLTFVVAGTAAVIADHLLRPAGKRSFKV